MDLAADVLVQWQQIRFEFMEIYLANELNLLFRGCERKQMNNKHFCCELFFIGLVRWFRLVFAFVK